MKAKTQYLFEICGVMKSQYRAAKSLSSHCRSQLKVMAWRKRYHGGFEEAENKLMWLSMKAENAENVAI